jgi:hypothetical protein
MGLLSNKRAFAVLQTLAKRLLFAGDRGIESVRALGFSLRTFEWKLEEMPSEVLSPRRGIGCRTRLADLTPDPAREPRNDARASAASPPTQHQGMKFVS